jgi:hypothetical protein
LDANKAFGDNLGRDRWTAEDWRAVFDERAAVAECGGGLPRPFAEAEAFEDCVIRWLNQNPVPSSPGLCIARRQGDQPDHVVMPYEGLQPGAVWMHVSCWETWWPERKNQAFDDLAKKQWLAIRKEAALKIDPETAEVLSVFARTLDPYGLGFDLAKEYDQVGRESFARAPNSDIWVWFGDLPDAIREALYSKHRDLALCTKRGLYSKHRSLGAAFG